MLSLYPDNPKFGRSSHSGMVVLFDDATGLPRACLDASAVTAMRTSAATAVATDELSRKDSKVLTIIGTGELAHAHVDAILAVRPGLARVVVWGRDCLKAYAFAKHHRSRIASNLHGKSNNASGASSTNKPEEVVFEVAKSIAEAVALADIVCLTTDAVSPLFFAHMLRPGMHVNAVGASVKTKQEVATDVVAAVVSQQQKATTTGNRNSGGDYSRYFTDFRASLEAQAAEVIAARAQGSVGPEFSPVEIGQVISGARTGRASQEDVTLYRSLGVIAQDLAAALHILECAERASVGVSVPWG
jgi:ornithine cyclodeaminase